ncbi:MAG: type II toxin-antitoxin system YafQ family toxin [Dysgonamonadaceae bacterium]|jgi:mRNA interferase YafQ|nr:type II toxin-antitoxin system YafQ family toxin [Dysgonamonadaceae bacterium]
MFKKIIRTNTFAREYKLAIKRNLPMNELDEIMIKIINKEILPVKYREHKLVGDYVNCWECHIRPDWLLLYEKNEIEDFVIFYRTGTHADIF